MTTAQEVMTKDVKTIQSHASMSEAVQHLRDHQVDCLLVEPVSPSDTWGVVSRTDVVRSIIAPNRDPAQMEVAEVMTKPITIVHPNTSAQECARLMVRQNIRRVFVFDGHNIVGIVRASDIFKTL
jgi:CBS domain-containing protein